MLAVARGAGGRGSLPGASKGEYGVAGGPGAAARHQTRTHAGAGGQAPGGFLGGVRTPKEETKKQELEKGQRRKRVK